VRSADVFVTNTPLDSRARLGIRWEDLAPLKHAADLRVDHRVRRAGEEAPRSGFDSTALWARTGLMDLVRPSPDSPPSRSLPGMGDHPTGVSLFAAIMSALYRREKTGTGTMVSTSLMANGLWWNPSRSRRRSRGHAWSPDRRATRRRPRWRTSTAARTGGWFLLNVLNDDRDWPALLRAIERPELASDGRFATTPARRANARALVVVLDTVFATRTWAEWQADPRRVRPHLRGPSPRSTTSGRIVRWWTAARLVAFDDPRAGAPLTVASPLWLDGVDKVPPRLPPELGEHSVAVLREAGYGEAEIKHLVASRVVVQS